MSAGLSPQQATARADDVPIGPRAGLAVAAAWVAVALAAEWWSVRRCDA
jgi:hypothetical protein